MMCSVKRTSSKQLLQRANYLLIALFVLALVANMESEPLIAWFGPWLSLAPTLLILRRWLSNPWRFALGVYGASILMGIVAMEILGMSNAQSARYAGWVFPPALCVAGTALVIVRRTVLARVLSREQLESADEATNRVLGAVGGAALGALIGAFAGAVVYYLLTLGLVFDLVFPGQADVLLISGSSLMGIIAGVSAGLTLMTDADRYAAELEATHGD
jgi:hypothetical protein